jgi:hypothetical protein
MGPNSIANARKPSAPSSKRGRRLISVKGKTETTRVFELLGASGRSRTTAAPETFTNKQASYLAQKWDSAEATFRECTTRS